MKTEKNILIAFLLNLFFSIFELVGGILTNSIAIISDAIHDFGDSLSIGISYFLEKKSKRKPDSKYTYGYSRYSILGAFITNSILIAGSILVIYNAIERIINPVEVKYHGMLGLAFAGMTINFCAAYFTKDGHSLNQKAVNLHMLEDVLGWFVVLVGAIIMNFTKIDIIDPILSILVALFVMVHAIKSFKEILDLFLVKIPSNIDINELKEHLEQINGVVGIHHIHIWSLDGVNNCATMHVITETSDYDNIKKMIKEEMSEHGISHTTLEIENKDSDCDELECTTKEVKNHHHHHH